jgi:hypothetical protein
MERSEVQRAVEAGSSTASALGLRVDDAVVVHNSNRVVVRLAPCDVLARVRPLVHQMADDLEVEVARRLAETDSPQAACPGSALAVAAGATNPPPYFCDGC